MKKVLLNLVCITILVIAAFTRNVSASAASIEYINLEETNNLSWTTDQKTVYLQVEETGFYDINVYDYYVQAELDIYFNDLDADEDTPFGDSYSCYFDDYKNENFEGNVYLNGGHLYEISLEYYYYDEDSEDCEIYYEAANIDITISKNNYQPTKLS